MLIMTLLLIIILKLILIPLILIWRCLVSCGTLSGPRTLGRPRRDTKAKAAGAKPECKTKNASRAGACARQPRSFRLEDGSTDLGHPFRNELEHSILALPFCVPPPHHPPPSKEEARKILEACCLQLLWLGFLVPWLPDVMAWLGRVTCL